MKLETSLAKQNFCDYWLSYATTLNPTKVHVLFIINTGQQCFEMYLIPWSNFVAMAAMILGIPRCRKCGDRYSHCRVEQTGPQSSKKRFDSWPVKRCLPSTAEENTFYLITAWCTLAQGNCRYPSKYKTTFNLWPNEDNAINPTPRPFTFWSIAYYFSCSKGSQSFCTFNNCWEIWQVKEVKEGEKIHVLKLSLLKS